jgi:hypothetical protein
LISPTNVGMSGDRKVKKTALRILVAVGISVFTSQLHLAIAASAPVEWTKKIISVPKKVQSKEVFSLQTYESNDREPVTQALSRELEIIRSEFHQDIKDHLGNPHAYHQVTVEIERMSSTFYVLTRRVSSWLGSAYPSDYSSRRYFHSTLLGPLKFGDIFSGDGWIEKICNLSVS